jgi:hypothetical protein
MMMVDNFNKFFHDLSYFDCIIKDCIFKFHAFFQICWLSSLEDKLA